MFWKRYSLNRCYRILRKGFHLYKKKSNRLTATQYREFEDDLKLLDQAILKKNKKEADRLARLVNSFINTHFPKTLFHFVKEVVGALLFAIVVAFFIRQFWFELYEVPTPSMYPTIKEQDRLYVSKTTFGIHFPFTKKIWLFNPDRIQRGSILIFTVANMDMEDSDTKYFYFFPGKKLLVKRAVAKGGDTIYFYGGRIYGIDKEGNPLEQLYNENWLKENHIAHIDHVPMITFDGKNKESHPIKKNIYSKSTLFQMNEPVGILEYKNDQIKGLFFNGTEWVKDQVNNLKEKHAKPESYADLWGFRNYAMVRLLSKKEAQKLYPQEGRDDNTSYYLEIRHTPNLSYPLPELRLSQTFVAQPMITPFKTLLPVDEPHLKKIMDVMTTARFIVKNGRAYRYREGKNRFQPIQFDVPLPKIPDGMYEFTRGIAYKVHAAGIYTLLPKDHPLYSKDNELIRSLFNMGITFNTLYAPTEVDQPFISQRFAFYRDGSLFIMGEPIFSPQELTTFVEKELKSQADSSESAPYIAFVDQGAPLKEGKLDVDFIKAFGLKVPENGVVGLGDNYANSGDSRDFGFIPMQNLRGAPSFIFWPPEERFGRLPQPSYPWITLPNMIIWSLATAIIVICFLWVQRKKRISLFKD